MDIQLLKSFEAIDFPSNEKEEVENSSYNELSWNFESNQSAQSNPIKLEASSRCPRYGMLSICGRRRDMEDAVPIRPDFLRYNSRITKKYHFFAVFDGHGCFHVADSCREQMHEIMAAEAEEESPSSPKWKAWMQRSFKRMDVEAVERGGAENPNCRCEFQTRSNNQVGSTAIVAVLSYDRIVISNCGDSRAVLSRSGAALPLSVDHKPDRPDELERIEAAGGRVVYQDGARVQGVLAMSRAIGEIYLKPFVTSEPEVTMVKRSDDDEFLILASDGLWDVVSNEIACDVARMCLMDNSPVNGDDWELVSRVDKGCSDAALLLTKIALARKSSDNVSVVVVDLRNS